MLAKQKKTNCKHTVVVCASDAVKYQRISIKSQNPDFCRLVATNCSSDQVIVLSVVKQNYIQQC